MTTIQIPAVAETITPAREHMFAVEADIDGRRVWRVLPEKMAHGEADMLAERNQFSDMEHAYSCWCMRING
jgi:hypothetical protein